MPRLLDLRTVRVARLLLSAFPVLLPLLFRGASAQVVLRRGDSFEWNGCYARLDRGELVVGNTHIVRRWKVEGGQLFP